MSVILCIFTYVHEYMHHLLNIMQPDASKHVQPVAL